MIFLRNVFILLSLISGSLFVPCAQAANDPAPVCCQELEAQKSRYLGENKFNEFIDLLNGAKDKDKVQELCRAYYKALTRYRQLKFLEEQQSWDDYFTNGNTYREQLEENAKQVISQSDSANCLKVKSRLLLWEFHRGQQDAFAQQALEDLITDTQAYAGSSADSELIKETADALLAADERSRARQIYKLYVDKLVTQKMTPEQLKSTAGNFYQQGNLELAQSIYDMYIEEITKSFSPEKLSAELFQIAGLFVYKKTGPFDMAYAEKIYSVIEKSSPQEAFDQDTIYMRAFNLEKMSEYKPALEIYLKLIQAYPQNKHYQEAVYKSAMIFAYSQLDIENARKHFDLLAQKTEITPYVISALYQLGLLSQWQQDNPKADGYYQQLIKLAQERYVLTVSRARERLQEIQENKPLEYNLKTFLDLSLKGEQALLESGKTELKSTAYILEKNQNNTISSNVSMPQSGCNQVELQYLWSGDLGGSKPQAGESAFQSLYSDSGTKEVNLVLVSPAGIIDRAFIMLDVE